MTGRRDDSCLVSDVARSWVGTNRSLCKRLVKEKETKPTIRSRAVVALAANPAEVSAAGRARTRCDVTSPRQECRGYRAGRPRALEFLRETVKTLYPAGARDMIKPFGQERCAPAGRVSRPVRPRCRPDWIVGHNETITFLHETGIR